MADETKPAKPLWMRPKVILVTIAAIILAIIIFQNLDSVETRILFLKMQMPQAVLLAVVAAIAFFVGVVTDGRVLRGGKKKSG